MGGRSQMESNLGELVGRDQEGVVGLAIDVAEEIAEIAVGAAAGVVVVAARVDLVAAAAITAAVVETDAGDQVDDGDDGAGARVQNPRVQAPATRPHQQHLAAALDSLDQSRHRPPTLHVSLQLFSVQTLRPRTQRRLFRRGRYAWLICRFICASLRKILWVFAHPLSWQWESKRPIPFYHARLATIEPSGRLNFEPSETARLV